MSAYEQNVTLAELAPSSEPNQSGPELATRSGNAWVRRREGRRYLLEGRLTLEAWTAAQLSQACTTVSRVILPSVSAQIPDASTRVPSSYWQAT